jgi:hypothetical protein
MFYFTLDQIRIKCSIPSTQTNRKNAKKKCFNMFKTLLHVQKHSINKFIIAKLENKTLTLIDTNCYTSLDVKTRVVRVDNILLATYIQVVNRFMPHLHIPSPTLFLDSLWCDQVCWPAMREVSERYVNANGNHYQLCGIAAVRHLKIQCEHYPWIATWTHIFERDSWRWPYHIISRSGLQCSENSLFCRRQRWREMGMN